MPVPSIWTGMYWPEQGVLPSLRRLHGQGWEWFELAFEHLEEIDESPERARLIEETRALVDELGVHMPQAHTHLHADVAHPDGAQRRAHVARLLRQFECAAALGVREVVVHPGTAQSTGNAKEWAAAVAHNREAFTRLGDRAGELGLRIGIENMLDDRRRKRRNFGARPEDLLELLRDLDHPALGITFDTSHAHAQGLMCAEAARAYGRLLWCTHLSDNDGSGDQHKIPGNGGVDWAALAEALREIGYQGRLNLEIPGEEHPVPELRALKVQHAREVTEWLCGRVGNGEQQ